MKRFPLLMMASLMLVLSISSCNDDGPIDYSELDPAKTLTIKRYVDNVVVATYKAMADESMHLYEACVALMENPTQTNIDKACAEWVSTRIYWEQSEAFLFGPAADYNIDPHIDSWPLDKALLDQALNNTILINNMKESGCNFDGFATLGYGLRGFHTVEYMLFRDGGPRNVNGGTDQDGITYGALSENELAYCAAVAEDLRNQCIRLEACWAGMDDISTEKQNILEETELEPTSNYGEMMELAGERGNALYKTQIAAYVQILQGASDIADEVGNTKITDPVSTGNVLDVESWYSWNSIDDFTDNIRSIRNAYFGNTFSSDASASAHASSVSAYVRSIRSTLDDEIKAAINKAMEEVSGMPAPFRNNLTEDATDDAIAACNALLVKLDQAIELIQQ